MYIVKKENNKIIVLKYSKFTEFVFKSKEFLNLINKYYENINENNFKDVASKILNELEIVSKEKGVVDWLLINSSLYINTYNHICYHKGYDYLCLKLLIIGCEDEINKSSMIELALELLSDNFYFKSNEYFEIQNSINFFNKVESDENIVSLIDKYSLKLKNIIKELSEKNNLLKNIKFCIVCTQN